MRVVLQVPHPVYRVIVYSWNEKYILEIEAGAFKQVYKLDHDKVSMAQIEKMLDATFLDRTHERFLSMKDDLIKALKTE